MKVSDYIINFLVEKKIDRVFGYVGGAIAHLYDSLDKIEEIEIVNTIHEQSAGFAAEAYARVTGKTGVAIATSGPGATNLLTPIGSCFFDSVPTIFITGQVSTREYKYDNPARQIGFQETDIVSIVKPVTKYAVMVDDLQNLRYEMEKAYYLSQEGRKGPVLIDIPSNLQFQSFDPESEESFFESEEYQEYIAKDQVESEIKKAAEMINHSKRPVILVGGGVRIADAGAELGSLLEKTNIPVIYSLMGKDLVKESYKYNLGFIGGFGNRYGNLTLANSDLLIVLGSRLDGRQVGNAKTFAREAKIIQVDIDKHELGQKVNTDLIIQSDIKPALEKLNMQQISCDITPWLEKVTEYRERFSSTLDVNQKEIIPNTIMDQISQYMKEDDIVCVDVGQHQMWAAQSLGMRDNQRILFSGGMGAMGFALPAAIGATLGTGKRSIVIVGDGGFQMNIQELEVIKRRNLPIKVFIFNNASLGMVRLQQEQYNEENYVGTEKDYSAPNFKDIGLAYGIKSCEVSGMKAINECIKSSLESDESEVIDIRLTESKNQLEPRLAIDRPMEDMLPLVDWDELERLMLIKPLDK
ncbi:MAG: thiamine pyrophosphate-binding protein [Campylobacterota bacterium]|nr:thiamine pyrophosphate-binding protein [Campylobacterota bacterium]